jgi:hypothetical protein
MRADSVRIASRCIRSASSCPASVWFSPIVSPHSQQCGSLYLTAYSAECVPCVPRLDVSAGRWAYIRNGPGCATSPCHPDSPPTSATVTAGPSARIRKGGAGGTLSSLSRETAMSWKCDSPLASEKSRTYRTRAHLAPRRRGQAPGGTRSGEVAVSYPADLTIRSVRDGARKARVWRLRPLGSAGCPAGRAGCGGEWADRGCA